MVIARIKPGFHMIATIAAIAEKKSSAIIWENGNSSAIAGE